MGDETVRTVSRASTELLKNFQSHIVSPPALNGNGSEQPGTSVIRKGTLQATVNAIAAKLGVATGPDLIIAAAAKLTFADGQDSFSRKVLLDTMKGAPNYYKQTYSNNLSGSLKRLQEDKRLTEPSAGNFALTAAERTKLEGLLV